MKTQEALEAIEKTSATCYRHLRDMTIHHRRAVLAGNEREARDISYRIRGALETLMMVGIIDSFGSRGLYLYYTNENELNKEAS